MAASDEQTRALVNMFVEEEFDTCIISNNQWRHLERMLRINSRWAEVGRPLLDTSGIITKLVFNDNGIAHESNISGILDAGCGGLVKYLVFHTSGMQQQQSLSDLYADLTGLVYKYVRPTHSTTFMSHIPSVLSRHLSHLFELLLSVLPSLQGILISRASCSVEKRETPGSRYINYCVMTRGKTERSLGLSDGSPLYIALNKDIADSTHRLELPLTLPFLASSLQYLCQRPLPKHMLDKIKDNFDGYDDECLHGCPEPMITHARRHLHYTPAMPFNNLDGSVTKYDWCRVIMDEDRHPRGQ